MKKLHRDKWSEYSGCSDTGIWFAGLKLLYWKWCVGKHIAVMQNSVLGPIYTHMNALL